MAALQQLVALIPTSGWAALQRFDADASSNNLSTSLASAVTVAPLLFSALISPRGGNRPETRGQQAEAGGAGPGQPPPPGGRE
ncbi:hypothetical protein, partial [Candidatus Nephthysia bennettiae]|nr:hypothetical protein [Candidatus Dormibacteraeota bacterium]